MFNFEKLDGWRKAIDFAALIYAVTRNFPDTERFGLTNQMRRASDSTSSNMAEGCSRNSKTDFARFTEIASGSLFEVVTQAFISQRQGLISQEQHQKIYPTAEETSKMLSGLRRSLLIPNRQDAD